MYVGGWKKEQRLPYSGALSCHGPRRVEVYVDNSPFVGGFFGVRRVLLDFSYCFNVRASRAIVRDRKSQC